MEIPILQLKSVFLRSSFEWSQTLRHINEHTVLDYIFFFFWVAICLCNFLVEFSVHKIKCVHETGVKGRIISFILIKLYQLGLQNKTGVKGTRVKLLMISFQ